VAIAFTEELFAVLSLSLPKRTSGGFQFFDPGELHDGELRLLLRETTPAMSGRVPTYRFELVREPDRAKVGALDLRIGQTPDVLVYAGHIGYRVHEGFRGQRYAARASRLVLPLAKMHGLRELWITCDPDNDASRRTCELIGGELVSTVAVPKSHPYYQTGSRAKCRFRILL
jgi:tagatose 1,6-diphosphate aldolase